MPDVGDFAAQLGPAPGVCPPGQLGEGSRRLVAAEWGIVATQADIEGAFMAATAALLEGDSGLLRYSNRSRLVDLASRLGIGAFEANLLIERARFRAGRGWTPFAPNGGPPEPAGTLTVPPRPSARLRRWLIVAAAAVLLDAVLLILLMVA